MYDMYISLFRGISGDFVIGSDYNGLLIEVATVVNLQNQQIKTLVVTTEGMKDKIKIDDMIQS